jgi:flagellar hook-associated protein 1 FlgK
LTPATIAAGNGTTGSPVPGNNVNAQNIAALQKSTIGSTYTGLVSEIGVSVQNANNVATNHQSFMRQIINLREANSGVSLDEELTNLIKYQRAFEGSAKLINTATEMLDVILGLVR